MLRINDVYFRVTLLLEALKCLCCLLNLEQSIFHIHY